MLCSSQRSWVNAREWRLLLINEFIILFANLCWHAHILSPCITRRIIWFVNAVVISFFHVWIINADHVTLLSEAQSTTAAGSWRRETFSSMRIWLQWQSETMHILVFWHPPPGQQQYSCSFEEQNKKGSLSLVKLSVLLQSPYLEPFHPLMTKEVNPLQHSHKHTNECTLTNQSSILNSHANAQMDGHTHTQEHAHTHPAHIPATVVGQPFVLKSFASKTVTGWLFHTGRSPKSLQGALPFCR